MLKPTPQVVLDLIKTREILVKHGRCCGRFRDGDGRVCMVGAMGLAINGKLVPMNLEHGRIANALAALGLYMDPFLWNDHVDDATVFARLDKAIAEQIAAG